MASKFSYLRTSLRHLGWLLTLPLLALLLALMLADWLVATETGTRAAFSIVKSASGGMLEAEAIHGRLLGPLQIGKLIVRQPESDIQITQLQLAWQPSALPERLLHITLLRAASVQFTQKALSTKPTRIDLPLQLQVDHIDIAHVQVAQAAQPMLDVHGVEGQLYFDGKHLRQATLNIRQLELAPLQRTWPQNSFSLQAQLEATGYGRLSLQNNAVGRLDQSRLPLRRATARFQLTDDALLVPDLQLDAGPGALIQGSASLRAEVLKLMLTTQSLNLRALDARLRATQLSGSASLTLAPAQTTQFSLALTEPWQNAPMKLTAQASMDANSLRIQSARLEHGKASATFSGALALTGARQFSAQGSLHQLRPQDYARLNNWPALILNGDFRAEGKRSAPAQAQLQFSVKDSSLQGHALAGDGKLILATDSLQIPHLLLLAGANQLKVQGALHASGSKLQFSLHAPQLSQLGPQFGGSLQLDGSASGTLAAPQVTATWQAHQLLLPGAIRMAEASGKTHLLLTPKQPLPVHQLEASINAQGIRRGTQAIGALQLELQGSMALDAPLALTANASQIAFDNLHLEQAQLQIKGSLHSHGIALNISRAGASHSLNATSSLAALDTPHPAWRGHFENVQLAALLALFEQSAVQATDVKLAGTWDSQLTGNAQTPLQVSVELHRESGDVMVRGTSPASPSATLGLQKFELVAGVSAGRLRVALKAEGRQLGQLAFKGSSAIAAGQVWQVDPHAAIDGALTLQLPSINWVGALLTSSVLAEGSLRGDVSVSGSWSDPQLKGHLEGQQLRLLLVDSGINFQRGVLDADFSGNAVTLRQLQFAGSSGELNITGPLHVSDGKLAASLAIQAKQFGVYDRSDRQLVLSGDATLALQEGRARVDGNVIVERGFFDIGRAGTPQLSDDVIVAGSPPQAQRALLLDLDIGIGLGEQLVLRGRGLDARMKGALRFSSKAGAPLRMVGLMQVSKGTFVAYGRELAIERGILRFDGAVGNPALDIRAMRRGTEVEPGVSIVGTALAPRIALVSEPQVPDAEKLAWLVLGHGLASSGGNELGDLQGAAASLLSQGAGAGIQSQLASAFGLDTISLSNQSNNSLNTQDTVQERIITLGKRVSSRLYVSYQQGLQIAAAVVLLRYTLTPHMTVEAESGTRSVFSLFYNMNFD
jgi:translocation and assembly module TamB